MRGQVHREREVVAPVVELADLPDAVGEHPVGELLDEAGVLGDTHEVTRRHDTADVMRPPHQCFGTDDQSAGEVELGLELQVEFEIVDGGAEVAEHREARRGATVELGPEELGAGVTGLGVEHRDVCMANRQFGVVGAAVEKCDSDARRDDDRESVEREGLLSGSDALLGDVEGPVFVGGVDHRSEFIAGETREEALRPELLGHAAGELDEQLIAGVVTERVVDLLEPVEVHHHHVALHALGGECCCGGEVALERQTIREAGERIVSRFVLDSTVEHPLAEARGQLIGEVLDTLCVFLREAGFGSVRIVRR